MLGTGERATRSCGGRWPRAIRDRVAATIGFDERLAHLIEAGADMFLMPSRFEPCGLNQMYSLRYGTVPVVRATGGLDDTVDDAGEAGRGDRLHVLRLHRRSAGRTRPPGAGGLPEPDALARRCSGAAMQQDYSWDASAREYVKVYRALTAEARDGRTAVTLRRQQITSHSVGGPSPNGDTQWHPRRCRP